MVDGDKIIGKHYQIQHKLGEGGMGAVYQGIDMRSGETVAIKQLKPDMTNAEMLERFKREGEALRELNHPNIVKMLDAFEVDGNHYLVMEYVSGGDLRQLLDQQGKLELKQCLNIAIDLADALTRAHRLDIIHRDLKPENVLITTEGTVRLTDFGVARLGQLERVTDTDATVGTIDYLAPEALSDEDIDERADIWAFGVMMSEMLLGKNPFSRQGIGMTLAAILYDDLPDLETLLPDIPVAFLDLIYRMLERDPHLRIRSVRAVGLELEDILYDRVDDTPKPARFDTPTTEIDVFRLSHNLPAQTTPFVGRETELQELSRLLDDPNIRLITVLAPGGMGKTRLALEAAEQQLDNFPDGVYFVDLAPLSDPSSVLPAIVDAIGLTLESGARTPKEQILDFLRDKNILLLMDNWEQLIEGASIVTELLHTAPALQILATSRRRLEQSGESLFQLSGMDFPDWETPSDAMEYAAVKLFMNSAIRVQPTFELAENNLDYVARICRLVGGMPLGIVLAASWLSMLSPEEVAQEISQSIEFLESTGGDIPARQRSIQAVFDYSWQMLAESERNVMMKLSIFRGGFTREAAQKVTGASLRDLMNLVTKSMIRRDIESGRYQIHELTRQYAAQKLDDSGEYHAVAQAHCAYFTDFMASISEEFMGENQLKVTRAFERDMENNLQAINWILQQRLIDYLDRIINTVYMIYFTLNLYAEGATLFRRIVDALKDNSADDDAQSLTYWRAYIRRVGIELFIGHPQSAVDQATYALPYLESYDAKRDIAFNLVTLTMANLWLGNLEDAETYGQQSLSIAQSIDDLWAMTITQGNLAWLQHLRGNDLKAIELQQKVNESAQKHGKSPTWMSLGNLNMGIYYHSMGQAQAAKEHLKECVHYSQLTSNTRTMAHAYRTLGEVSHFTGNYHDAVEYNQKALQIVQEMGDRRSIADALLSLADAQRYLGHVDDAQKSLFEAENLYESVGDKRGLGNVYAILGWLHNETDDNTTQLEYAQKSLEMRKQINNAMDIVDSMAGIAICYNNMEEYDKALAILDEATELAVKENLRHPQTLGQLEGFRTMVYIQQGKYQEAYDFLKDTQSFLNSEIEGNQWGRMQVNAMMGLACLGINQINEARGYLVESLKIALQIGTTRLSYGSILGATRIVYLNGKDAVQVLSYLIHVQSNWTSGIPYRNVIALADIEGIKSSLTPKQIAEAEHISKTLDLRAMIQTLVEELDQ